MIRILLIIVLLGAVKVLAELIPANQLTDWTPGTRVGVIGGIPTTRTQFVDATQSPYNADKTGATDATTAIQNALNACPANQYVFLPAGSYKVNALQIPNNVTLRGAGSSGATVTTLRCQTTGTAVHAGAGYNYLWSGQVAVTAGNTTGSTVLTVADTSSFTVGVMARLAWTDMTDNTTLGNGTNYIVTSTSGSNYGGIWRRQMVNITAKTATTLTIFPPIIHTVQSGTSAVIASGNNQGTGAGVEDLYITNADVNPARGVWFEQCQNSWIKNVRSEASNYPFYFQDCINVEITHSYGSGGTGSSPNGAGILVNTVTGGYVYDNAIFGVFPGFEINGGTTGSVFAYNLLEGTPTVPGTLNMNHGPHNSHNLHEGNICPSVQSDGYYGSASQLTIFRNWITGTNLTQSFYTYFISLNRWNSYNSVVGNLVGVLGYPGSGTAYNLGLPNIGNGSFTGSYKISANSFPVEWKLPASLTSGAGTSSGVLSVPSDNIRGYKCVFHYGSGNWFMMTNVAAADTVATSTSFTVEADQSFTGILPANGTTGVYWGGPTSFQGQDQDVYATYSGGRTNLRVNCDLRTGSIPVNEALGADTFPNSLYLSSKPTWFRSLNWPPFNPQSPGSLTVNQRYQTIPAGYRFVNGVDPPTGTDTTPPTLVSQTIGASGTQLSLAFNETVAIGLGGSGGWTINMSGTGTETLTYVSGSGTSTLVFNISRAISAGETGTITYTQPGNGVEDTAGNDLATISTPRTVNNQASGDTTAPTPNPSTFSIVPQATGPSAITMTATTATDPSGPVQYYFNETTGNAGGNDSGWQSSPTYIDTGLAAGTQYSYRVQVRDAVPTPNVTTFSSSLSAITRVSAGARPATPFKMARANIANP